MVLHKQVNGVKVQLSDDEEAATRAEWEANRLATEAIKWQRDRENAYPSVTNQFDMIWNELNRKGSIAIDGEWFLQIKAIKEKYPKP